MILVKGANYMGTNMTLLLIIVVLAMALFCMWELLIDKKNKIKALEADISTLEYRIDSCRITNEFLKNTVNIIDKYKVGNNQQIIDAIKYAMKKSHPDNGGNAEDFKKFRDLYNNIKRGNYEESI